MDYNAERLLEQALDIFAANAANRSAHSIASRQLPVPISAKNGHPWRLVSNSYEFPFSFPGKGLWLERIDSEECRCRREGFSINAQSRSQTLTILMPDR